MKIGDLIIADYNDEKFGLIIDNADKYIPDSIWWVLWSTGDILKCHISFMRIINSKNQ
tara:strand:- start:328 stop:501 length:174 start_codon:yes stop_codon:yes gene_type:complete